MAPLNAPTLPVGTLLLVDTAPSIYQLEAHATLAARFLPLFQRHAAGEVVLAISTMTLAEVLTGPLETADEVLARRCRAVLESWRIVELTAGNAESAARLRARYGLKLPNAVPLTRALAINAHALVTQDRDFTAIEGLRVRA